MKRQFLISATAWLCFCLAFSGGISYAQSPNATVSGYVTDSTGAVVSNATIVLTDKGTGVTSKTVSNGAGLYRLSGLIPGTYQASVSRQGFKSLVRDNIALHVEDQAQLNFSLEIGQITQQVTVSATASLLDTQSTSLGGVIQGRQVQDTPLNGRNAMNLVALVPGVVPQGTTSGSASSNQGAASANPAGFGNYQIDGGVAGWNATYLDGAPLNVAGQNWQALVPTQDSIGEFKVDTNAVSPQYGRYAGGIISFSTKSGTNRFHGSLYEYLRNTDFDANTYFNNQRGLPRPVLHQNQFGATVGGPVVKSKAFFFFSYESTRLSTTQDYEALVPDANFLAGDFSGFPGANNTTGNLYYDPKAGGPADYMGQPNHVNPADFDPTALTMVGIGYFAPANAENLMPTFNSQGVNNQGNVANQYAGRVDEQLSSKQSVFARYSYWNINIPHQGGANPSPLLPPAGMEFTTNQVVVGDNYQFSPTLDGDFSASYTRFNFKAGLAGNGNPNLALLGPTFEALGALESVKMYPTLYPSGSALWSNAPSVFNNLQYDKDNNYALSGIFTKVIGHHSIVFGAEARRLEWYNQATTHGGGNFGFSGSNAMINFLEGVVTANPGTSVMTTTSAPSAYTYYQGYYVTDTYQMTPKLNLNYGLRWELPGAWYVRGDEDSVLLPDAENPMGNVVNPVTGESVAVTGILANLNSPQYKSHSQMELHLHLFEPRVGVNYAVTQRTAVHAGFGISAPCIDCGSFSTAPSASPLSSATTTAGSSLSDPFPNGILQPLRRNLNIMQPASEFPLTLEGTTIGGQEPYQTYPYVMQWNTELEQSLDAMTTFSISYAGSRGVHLSGPDINLNQLPDQYDSLGSQLLTQVTNPFMGELNASSPLNGATINYGQLLVPHPQFVSFSSAGKFRGESDYNALNATLQRRFAMGATVNAAYTWAHLISTIDTTNGYLEPEGAPGPQDYTNPKADRSDSGADVRQRLIVNYLLDLPFGHGKRFLSSVRGWQNQVVSGWSLAGISTFQSGFPLGFGYAPGTILANDFGAGSPRPNVVAGCNKSMPGGSRSRLGEWFNTACFTAPSQYGFGNESRVDSAVHAQGIDNWDMSITKTGEIHSGVSLQFRAEMFNLFNHAQFSAPNTSLGSGNFGQVTGTTNQPRVGQFSLRLNY